MNMTLQKMRISFWQRLFDMVCPKSCGVCGRRLGLNEEVLCGTCNLHLARTGHASHPTDNEMAKAFWGRISIEKAAALFHYQPQSQTARLIYNLKYYGHEDFGERMGEMTAREFDEKGFFDLHGSTIVLLLQKDKVKLLKEIQEITSAGTEYRVKIGQTVAVKI